MDIQEIRDKSKVMLDAVSGCGTVKKYGDKMGISRSTASNRKNNPEMEIPYQDCLLQEILMGDNLETLSPSHKDITALFRKNYKRIEPAYREQAIKSIVIPERLYHQSQLPSHSIILGNDNVLMTGLAALQAQEAAGSLTVSVVVIDLLTLLSCKRLLREVNPYPFLKTEKLWIYWRAKEYLGHRQGRPKAAEKKVALTSSKEPSKKAQEALLIRPLWDEFHGRSDEELAKLLDLDSKSSLNRLIQIVNKGIPALLAALDQKHIKVGVAFNMAQLSVAKQEIQLQSHLAGVTPT